MANVDLSPPTHCMSDNQGRLTLFSCNDSCSCFLKEISHFPLVELSDCVGVGLCEVLVGPGIHGPDPVHQWGVGHQLLVERGVARQGPCARHKTEVIALRYARFANLYTYIQIMCTNNKRWAGAPTCPPNFKLCHRSVAGMNSKKISVTGRNTSTTFQRCTHPICINVQEKCAISRVL